MWKDIAAIIESELNAIKYFSIDIDVMIDYVDPTHEYLQHIFVELLRKKYNILFDIIGVTSNECSNSDPLAFDAYLETLRDVMDSTADDVRFMLNVVANDDYKCY